MRIYSMTATFGKLNHETLTLNPGLNVIHAPNEWGKSTWCAFLVSMLYGIDTKQRAAGGILPDKEKYKPWSGMPMSGRIDLCWNGRDITIERSTQGRLIMGVFRAYETESGLDIPELDSANCGKMLLGVERSVFTRAGFIRMTDMPVTADEALRRRLNDLVTTGDDSGSGDQLSSALRDLKNKCRYNNSGLLPQAETEREQLRRQLDQIMDLKNRSQQLRHQEEALSQQVDLLSNHELTLRYNAAKEDTLRIEKAEADLQTVSQRIASLHARLEQLPEPAQARTALDAGHLLQKDYEALELERKLLPPQPVAPTVPEHFANLNPEQAIALSRAHLERSKILEKQKASTTGGITFSAILLGLSVLAALLLAVLQISVIAAGVCAAVAVVAAILLLVFVKKRINQRTEYDELRAAHPGLAPEHWVEDAEHFKARTQYYIQTNEDYQRRTDDLQRRQQLLSKQIALFAGEATLEQRLQQWNDALTCQTQLDAALEDYAAREQFVQSLRAMVRPVEAPSHPDSLDLPMEQTTHLLATARQELQDVQAQLHQCAGRTEALGQEEVLRSRLDTLLRRISRLEDTYFALEMAQNALFSATTELQKRFAPKISKRAQELFGQLTQGRYDRLTMAEDFSLRVSAADENETRDTRYRSDGTVDQLYLALRLAVAEALTPDAPLVLDDALVRFDDQRLQNAMTLLKQFSENKQVILFSCHKRELES